ncbi:MAG: hypothetical protein Alis3KO_41450 [Aliiglaciecola sp.]
MEKHLSKPPWEIIYLLKSKGVLEKKENMDQIQRYLVECCKRIWILIPDSGSRKGVLAAEQFLNGEILWETAYETDWYSEASAFLFDYSDPTEPQVKKYVNAVAAQLSEYEELLCPPQKISNIQGLLKDAAYFANTALCYPAIRFGLRHRESMKQISKFMPDYLFEKAVAKSLYETVL